MEGKKIVIKTAIVREADSGIPVGKFHKADSLPDFLGAAVEQVLRDGGFTVEFVDEPNEPICVTDFGLPDIPREEALVIGRKCMAIDKVSSFRWAWDGRTSREYLIACRNHDPDFTEAFKANYPDEWKTLFDE